MRIAIFELERIINETQDFKRSARGAQVSVERALEILEDLQLLAWGSDFYKVFSNKDSSLPGEKFVFTIEERGEKKGFFTESGIVKEMEAALRPAFGSGAVLVNFNGVEVYCSPREAWAFNLK